METGNLITGRQLSTGWPPADRGGARSDRRRAQWLVEGVERSGAVRNGHSVLPDRTWSPSRKGRRVLVHYRLPLPLSPSNSVPNDHCVPRCCWAGGQLGGALLRRGEISPHARERGRGRCAVLLVLGGLAR